MSYYYAKRQPECDEYLLEQEFDNFMELAAETAPIIIRGNRDLKDYNTDVFESLSALSADLDYAKEYETAEDVKSVIKAFFGMTDLPTGKEAEEVYKNAMEYYEEESAESICYLLQKLYDVKYSEQCIRGYCQGDWQNVYLPDGADRNLLEALYFGKMTEYVISESRLDSPEDFEEADVYVALVEDDLEAAERKAVANIIGCEVDEVKIATVKNSYTQIIYEYSDFT
jgi:hypothetical protein